MIKIKNKTRYKTKILGIALLSILLLIGLIPLIQLEPSTNTTLLENSNLNSAEAVTISSPSGTYSTGMSGYYPAFFGFENDNSGSNPSYWYCYEPTGTTIEVQDQAAWSHRKFLNMADNTNSYAAVALQSFGCSIGGCYSMQSCTVECWVKTSNAVKPTAMALDSPDYFLMVTIGIANNKLYLWDQYGTPQATPKSIVSNQWYHLSIYIQWWWTFLQPPAPPGTVSYILQYWVTVNDLNTYTLGRFENGNDIWYPITRLHFSTADIYSGYSSSFDAVGYSWHDDYNVGDNLNTGLLLDFEPDQDDGATGMTYKLDSGPVYSTLGDMVIPLPADGEHTIQVNVTGYDPGTSSFSVDTTP